VGFNRVQFASRRFLLGMTGVKLSCILAEAQRASGGYTPPQKLARRRGSNVRMLQTVEKFHLNNEQVVEQ
jgi:hypothetical protein